MNNQQFIFRCLNLFAATFIVSIVFLVACNDNSSLGNQGTESPELPDSSLFKKIPVSIIYDNSAIKLLHQSCYVSRISQRSDYGSYSLLFKNSGNALVYFSSIHGITYYDSTGLLICSKQSSYIFSKTIKLTPSNICINSGFFPGDTGGVIGIEDSLFNRIARITIDSISFDTGSFTLPGAILSLTSYKRYTVNALHFTIFNNGSNSANTMGFNEAIMVDGEGIPMAWAMAFPLEDENIIPAGSSGILSSGSARQVPWAKVHLFYDYEDAVGVTEKRKLAVHNIISPHEEEQLIEYVRLRNEKEAEAKKRSLLKIDIKDQ